MVTLLVEVRGRDVGEGADEAAGVVAELGVALVRGGGLLHEGDDHVALEGAARGVIQILLDPADSQDGSILPAVHIDLAAVIDDLRDVAELRGVHVFGVGRCDLHRLHGQGAACPVGLVHLREGPRFRRLAAGSAARERRERQQHAQAEQGGQKSSRRAYRPVFLHCSTSCCFFSDPRAAPDRSYDCMRDRPGFIRTVRETPRGRGRSP